MPAKKTQESIPPLDLGIVEVMICGDTPLLTDAKPERMFDEIRDGNIGAAKGGKRKPKPEDWLEKLYVIDARKKRYGFPVSGLMKAIVEAATTIGAFKTDTRKAFYVRGSFDHPRVGELVEIVAKPPIMREDQIKGGNLCYRAMFQAWKIKLTIEYDKAQITPAQVVNLLNRAGFAVGIGNWRKEKGGTFGRFHVGAK